MSLCCWAVEHLSASERAVTQSILSVIGECVDQSGPGCVGVQKILNAPTVNMYCTVCLDCHSVCLYLYGWLDRRVRCLVSIPGARITNFSLTAMVLFFLQRRTVPILPTLDHLKELAEQLLKEFFEFYGTFTFNRMSLNFRRTLTEHSWSASWRCRESAWMMRQREFNVPHSSGSNGTGTRDNAPWGLAVLLMYSVSQVAEIKGRKKRKREPVSKRIKSLLESLRNREEKKTGNGINTTRKKS
uniref:PAP-associated domain-containing protein n=1 Tax=Hucho hucho TaxID=62062 RepID=A0A4W5LEL3_9TELE